MGLWADREPSTTQLIGDLATDIRTLVRQELALARAELREELGQFLAALAAAAVGAAALGAAGLWMLVALTRAIAEVFRWPLGGAYAFVGVTLAVVGGLCAGVAWHQGREIRFLPRTRETLTAR